MGARMSEGRGGWGVLMMGWKVKGGGSVKGSVAREDNGIPVPILSIMGDGLSLTRKGRSYLCCDARVTRDDLNEQKHVGSAFVRSPLCFTKDSWC
jgi:hypothetical protein